MLNKNSPNVASQAAIEQQRNDLKNLRYHNRMGSEGASRQLPLRPVSNSRESETPIGFRAILKRHDASRMSHIDRIRRCNLLSAHQPRSPSLGVAPSSNEQLMKIKNEQAIQRAMKRQNENKPPLVASPISKEAKKQPPSSARIAAISENVLTELK